MNLINSSTYKSIKTPIKIISLISNRNKFRVFFSFFLMTVSSIFESVTILSITIIIAKLESGSASDVNIFGLNKFLSKIDLNIDPTIFFILIILFSSSIKIYTLWFNGKTAANIGNEVSKIAFSKILNWPYEKHTKVNSSSLIANLTQFTKQAVGTVNNFLLLMNFLLISAGISITLMKVNLKISLILLFLLIITYLVNNLITRKYIKRASKIMKIETLNIFKITKEAFEGIKDLILDDRKKEEIKYFQSKDMILKHAVVGAKFISSYPKYLFEALMIIGLIVIVIINQSSTNNFNNLSQLSIFAFGAQKLLPSVQQIYTSITAIKHAESKTDAIIEIIDDKKTNSNKNNYSDSKNRITKAPKKVIFKDILELNKISFKYNNSDKYAVKDFNLTLKKGEFLAIMGPSGSGKTSILDMIMGLIRPANGFIKVDNKYIFKDNKFNYLKDWQYSISHVPQNVYLLDTTIRQNIVMNKRLSKEKAKKRLKEVCEVACINEIVDSLPMGIDSIVGERGSLLSGGQVQRIGIARAIYNESPLIIFDEATSALDWDIEKKLLENIRGYCKNSSLIMVTHREKSTFICDRVIKF